MIADLRRCEQYPDVTISCFVEEGLGQLDCAQYILKAFVYQLRDCRNPIVSDVLLRSTLKEIERLEVPVSLEAFQRCLRTMLAGVSDQARVVLILDGLDSNDWIRTVIMNEIIWANLPRQRSNVFRCTISTQATFDAALRNYVAEINLDVEPDSNEICKSLLRYGLLICLGPRITNPYRSLLSWSAFVLVLTGSFYG